MGGKARAGLIGHGSGTAARAWGRAKARAGAASLRARGALGRALREERGQGTTEYAILVGVLVVIAIVAIIAFRDKLTELWTAISDGINGL